MCKNKSRCGCSSNRQCENFGPFVAIDVACITSSSQSTGSIIPFSSGSTPAILTTTDSGSVNTVSLVGFGTSVSGVALTGTNIDITTTGSEAFSVPRTGSITSISASFTATLSSTQLPGLTTISAQVYRAPANSNVFSPTTVFVNLVPSLTSIPVGTIASAVANVTPLPVTAGDRLLMVFSATSGGFISLTGNASAGINIV